MCLSHPLGLFNPTVRSKKQDYAGNPERTFVGCLGRTIGRVWIWKALDYSQSIPGIQKPHHVHFCILWATTTNSVSLSHCSTQPCSFLFELFKVFFMRTLHSVMALRIDCSFQLRILEDYF